MREDFTPFMVSKSKILTVMQRKHDVHWPQIMRSPVGARSKDKWCKFHKDHGYNTEDCVQLKREVERLLEQSHLKEFIRVRKPRRDK